MIRLLVGVALVVGGVAGCDADAGPAIAPERLGSLVVQPRDLPKAFDRFDYGEITEADLRAGPRGDFDRFGREAGWKARYQRTATATVNGPVLVESLVDLFDSDDGAEQDLDAYRAVFRQTARVTELPAPGIGDASAAITGAQLVGTSAARYFVVAWREGPVTASVSVTGFEGRVGPSDAVRLARAQQRRIRAALAD